MNTRGLSSSRLSAAAVNSAAMSSFDRPCLKRRMASDNRHRGIDLALRRLTERGSHMPGNQLVCTHVGGPLLLHAARMPAFGTGVVPIECRTDRAHQRAAAFGDDEARSVYTSESIADQR